MKITNDIFQVGGSGFSADEDAAVYLVRSGNHAAVIDAGCGNETDRILSNIETCGVSPDQVDYLLLTHCHYDHTGGAKDLADALDCKIVAHKLDAKYLEAGDNRVTAASWYGASIDPFQVDIKISDAKKTLILGEKKIEAIHIPGHSPGSLVYLTESEGVKVLFGQDIHGPLDKDLLSDRADYQRSLQEILKLNAEILCEGHFGVYFGKKTVRQFVEQYLK